jgi:cysteine dioxygenase
MNHEPQILDQVRGNLSRWFPRAEEYKQYIHWDLGDKTKYTRNLIFSNEHMDVLLMCWPAGSKSAIHSHDDSSCWVALVEGQVWEVQYDMPKCDLQFMEKEEKDPTGAMGRCSRLRVIGETKLTLDGSSASYANDEIGVHRIENRSNKPAYTLHVYAPGVRMKLSARTRIMAVGKDEAALL